MTRQSKSWLKKGLDALLKPAEDPRQTAAYMPQRQHELLLKVQQALTEVAHIREGLVNKTAVMQTRLPLFEEQARQALARGQEDQARLAIRRCQITAVELQSINEQLKGIGQKEQQLLFVEQHLLSQIEAFVARQETMEARYQTAVSQTQIHKAIQDVFRDLADLGETIEAAEAHTERVEARVDWQDTAFADGLMTGTGLPVDGVGDYVGLETAVETELARLKVALGDSKLAAARKSELDKR